MSGLINKAKAVAEDVKQEVHKATGPKQGHNTTTGTTAGTTAGAPSHSGVTGTSGHSGIGGTSGHSGVGGTSAGHSSGITGTTHGSTNAGPHDTNVANKVDPRVDSDLDGGRHGGLNQTTHTGHGTTGGGLTGTSGVTAGHTGHGATGGGLASGTTGTTAGHGSTNAGPHNSNIANKLDPRVDSDLDGSRNAGANQTTSTGYGSSTTGAGYGGSTMGTSHTSTGPGAGYGSNTTGTSHGTTGLGGTAGHAGTTTTTASKNEGPHKTGFMNKMDPRVDSDRDGSSNAGASRHDASRPLDASTHRPSEFHSVHGDPTLEHDHASHHDRHGGRGNLEDYSSGRIQ